MTIHDSLEYVQKLGKLTREREVLKVFKPSETLSDEDRQQINVFLYDWTANLDQDVSGLSDQEFQTALELGIKNESLDGAKVIQVDSGINIEAFSSVSSVEYVEESGDTLDTNPREEFEAAAQIISNDSRDNALFWKRVRT